jgi:hypothetical protein
MAKTRVGVRVPSLWNGLLAYYRADGTSNDQTGNYNGVLTNGTTYGTGKINQGFSLDGVNDYVDIGSRQIFNNTQSFTFSCWINANQIRNRLLITNANTTGGGANLSIWSDGVSRKLALIGGNGSGNQTFGNTTLSTSTWYHLVIVHTPYDGVNSNVTFYVNGSNDGTGIFDAGTSSDVANQYIGTNTTFGGFFSGIIDEIGIWNKALKSSEVEELYNEGNGNQK